MTEGASHLRPRPASGEGDRRESPPEKPPEQEATEQQPLSDEEFKERLIETMPHLRAFARSLTRDHAAADGIVQDTLLKAWAARGSFIPTKPMRAWTFVILRNTYYSRFRRQKMTGEYDEAEAERILTVDAAQEDPLHLSDLHDALMELTDDQREAVILVGAGGFAYREAAEIVGCAEGTIKSRVSRAREGLLVLLQRKFSTRRGAASNVTASEAYDRIVAAVDSYTDAT
jgi:RNA polymerase sigma-70 factor (ECF subfamily)